MSNTVIQQSLIDIEQNLKKLESAREQVKNVTHSSEKLTVSISELANLVDILLGALRDDKEELVRTMKTNLEKVQSDLSLITKEFEENSSKLNEKQSLSVDEAIANFKKLDSTVENLRKSLESFDLETNFQLVLKQLNGLNEDIITLKSNVENNTEELSKKMDSISANQLKTMKTFLIVTLASIGILGLLAILF
ncbi:MAG: hypothetical protein IT221_03560 [Fluviicola sp.]|nr:hypothetical protein [Fluviicola sp.]